MLRILLVQLTYKKHILYIFFIYIYIYIYIQQATRIGDKEMSFHHHHTSNVNLVARYLPFASLDAYKKTWRQLQKMCIEQ